MPYDPVQEHEGNQLLREVMKKNYNPTKYKMEKIIGRRTRTGALKLKKLKPLHRQMIHMHIGCFSNRDIAFHLDVDEITVSRVLNDPLSIEILNVHAQGIDAELEALLPLGVDVVRKALLSDSPRTALQGVDKLFRALGKFNHTGDGQERETAEDVIARALGIAQTSVSIVKELTRNERPKALNVPFERVDDDNHLNSPDKDLARLT